MVGGSAPSFSSPALPRTPDRSERPNPRLGRESLLVCKLHNSKPGLALRGRVGLAPGVRAGLALRGRDGYRVRVGDYRILYTVRDEILVVVVVAPC